MARRPIFCNGASSTRTYPSSTCRRTTGGHQIWGGIEDLHDTLLSAAAEGEPLDALADGVAAHDAGFAPSPLDTLDRGLVADLR